MTDQDNSNSPSNEYEAVTEYTLAENFLRQYKKFKLGMLEGGVFTDREKQALVVTATGQPEVFTAFIHNTALILTDYAHEELMPEEVLECNQQFHKVVLEIVTHGIIPWLKMSAMQRESMLAEYYTNKERAKERGSEDPLANLDFTMPDFKPGDNPDA